jgi:hypothetical protein
MNTIVGQIVEVLSESTQNEASSSISQIATKVLEFFEKQFKENSEAQHKLNRFLKEPKSQKQAFSEFLVKAVQASPLLETVLSQFLSELEWSERERIRDLVTAENLEDTKPNIPVVVPTNIEGDRGVTSLGSKGNVEDVIRESALKYQLKPKQPVAAADDAFHARHAYWYQLIHNHFLRSLLPHLTSQGEKFIEYWPTWILWGVYSVQDISGDSEYFRTYEKNMVHMQPAIFAYQIKIFTLQPLPN